MKITKGGLLWVLSWLVALYFGVGFIAKAAFPPRTELLIGDALFVGLTLFFLFLPFFDKIKIGSWIELERKVEEAKKEAFDAKEQLREFKTEVRNTLALVSTNLNTQRMSTQLNIYGSFDPEKLRDAQAKIAEKLDANDRSTVESYENAVRASQNGDTPLMLAKVRIDIERLLRKIVGARLTASQVATKDPIKFATARQLFERLVNSDDNYAYLEEPFRYVNSICNAALHAQPVPPQQADEAVRMGAEIIEVLSKHPDASNGEAALA
ncbi:hypothetical protein [Paraburkholderia sp. CI3]|uniref:hypothetical protein n=1 Tax=Paraburkholderia sp. CI3 TaxID=2991060 RepID=UPI003D1A8E09